MVTPVPFTSVYLLDGVWNFVWAAGYGFVRVVLWGNVLTDTTANTFRYPASSLYASATAAPPVEVVLATAELVWVDGQTLEWSDGEDLTFGDAGGVALTQSNTPRLVLQWYRVPCHHYRIEVKDTGGVYRFFSTVPDNLLVTIQTLITPLLPDGGETVWRIIAVDGNKRESDPLGFRAVVCRPPDPPPPPIVTCTAGNLAVG